jgi:hypothetical protein
MMFGFGFLMMLLVIGLPLLLVVVLAGGLVGIIQKQNRPTDNWRGPNSVASKPVVAPTPMLATTTRSCTHCGASLQSDWSHCPQCGAPAGQ